MNEWQYQLRVYLTDEWTSVARNDRSNPALRPLVEILNEHHAALVNQLDAFESYVADAEKGGLGDYPLYKWTKAIIEDPVKRAKHIKTFALHVRGDEVYSKAAADALEIALQPLVGGDLVASISKHDTNPSSNLRVPSEYRP